MEAGEGGGGGRGWAVCWHLNSGVDILSSEIDYSHISFGYTQKIYVRIQAVQATEALPVPEALYKAVESYREWPQG